MNECSIRVATAGDAPAIEMLSAQLGYASSVEDTVARLEALLESRDHAVLVACVGDGTVVGWVHVFKALRLESDSFAELGGFIVAESHRGQGIGRKLLGVAERWSQESAVGNLRVRTRIERKEAHAFYRRMGFSLTKVQSVFDKGIEADT